jgi:hypothetical protein
MGSRVKRRVRTKKTVLRFQGDSQKDPFSRSVAQLSISLLKSTIPTTKLRYGLNLDKTTVFWRVMRGIREEKSRNKSTLTLS